MSTENKTAQLITKLIRESAKGNVTWDVKEVPRALNYETEQDGDSFRITNLDRKLETEFSTRRQEILQSLKESGHSGAKASEIAALSTRKAKDHSLSKVEIKQDWLNRAQELGYTSEMIDFLRENEAIKERAINKEEILEEEEVKYEVRGVYGVYDIVLKISSDDAEKLRGIITNKIRKISKVQSTLTMMVIEEQENL